MLAEAASDLMAMRLSSQRGFDLPALAGPADTGKGWVERPADNLEGVASAVDSSASAGLAEEIIRDLGKAVGSTNRSDEPLHERLAAIADAVDARPNLGTTSDSTAGHAPALKGGWTLLQEMSIREAAQGLRNEYTVRRQILLRRLDVTVQVMCNCDRIATIQRQSADILSRMWSGWRRSANEAPPLSEWSALAVTRGVLARAIAARVSGPGARVSSKVKKISIGDVPNRGGKPEGYTKKDTAPTQEAGGTAATAPAPKAQRGPRQRTFASGSGGGSVGASSSAASGAAASGVANGAASSLADAGNVLGGEGASANVGSASASSAAPRSNNVSGEPASIGAKKDEKKAPTGARSTNKDAHKEYRQQKRKEWEGKVTNTYYEDLQKNRG